VSDTRTIITDDGCVIACDYRPRGDAPTVVLSPSLGTAMALFDAQLEALADCYSILRYDPRGHGSSAIPEGGYSLDRLGRDVIGLLDAFDIDRAHFVGVSLGGMTGQWLGYRAPERLLTLTLNVGLRRPSAQLAKPKSRGSQLCSPRRHQKDMPGAAPQSATWIYAGQQALLMYPLWLLPGRKIRQHHLSMLIISHLPLMGRNW